MAFLFAALSAGVFWQLPTYSGTKSYQNLLVGVYEIQESYSSIGTTKNSDSVLHFSPIGFDRNREYDYKFGTNYMSDRGYFWEANPSNTADAIRLVFFSGYLAPQNNYAKGQGYSLRCLAR